MSIDIIRAIEIGMQKEISNLFEEEKEKAIKDLTEKLNSKKDEIVGRLAVQISQRINPNTTDREIIIRMKG